MRTLPITERRRAVRFFSDLMAYTLGPIETDRLRKERHDVVIVDVRKPEDYREGHVPGAINLPREQWGTLAGLEKGKEHVFYCYTQQCHAAHEACLRFAREGYRVKLMEGGWKAWREYGLEAEGETVVRKAA